MLDGDIKQYKEFWESGIQFMQTKITLFDIDFSMYELFIYGTLCYLLLRFVFRLFK